ncbi:hypothetical protein [Larkinella arboricola]
MRQIVLFLAILVTACAPQQRLRVEPNRLLRHSADVNNTGVDQAITAIRPAFPSFGNLVVRYADGRTEKVSRKSVWGYTDKKGRVYRQYGNSYYEVIDMGEVVQYERKNPQPNQRYRRYSKTLDSKLYLTRKKALRDVAAL